MLLFQARVALFWDADLPRCSGLLLWYRTCGLAVRFVALSPREWFRTKPTRMYNIVLPIFSLCYCLLPRWGLHDGSGGWPPQRRRAHVIAAKSRLLERYSQHGPGRCDRAWLVVLTVSRSISGQTTCTLVFNGARDSAHFWQGLLVNDRRPINAAVWYPDIDNWPITPWF